MHDLTHDAKRDFITISRAFQVSGNAAVVSILIPIDPLENETLVAEDNSGSNIMLQLLPLQDQERKGIRLQF